VSKPDGSYEYRTLDQLRLADVDAIRLVLKGSSIVDWRRLNFESRAQAVEFVGAQEFVLENPEDQIRIEAIKKEAISYLRRTFRFPVPKPVEEMHIVDLLMLASYKGHRQMCACAILKVMNIIHHLEAHEFLFMLPISIQEVFRLVEEKVYRVIGSMLARGFPILEFIGGRKHKDSLYTKLLSKSDTTAASIYDKLRFRIVTRSKDDIFPILNYMLHHIFPFNYVIPAQSTNTMFHFRHYCEQHPHLSELFGKLQLSPDLEDVLIKMENRYSASSYLTAHFVVDLPVRLPEQYLEKAPPAVQQLGPVIFMQTEFQLIDRKSDQNNELSEASHAAYKERQKNAVIRRLKAGYEPPKRPSRKPKK